MILSKLCKFRKNQKSEGHNTDPPKLKFWGRIQIFQPKLCKELVKILQALIFETFTS